jgi:cyclic pyranopterin phosphate synthase
MTKFSHLDKKNNPQMVDVSHKDVTKRTAKAQAIIAVGNDIIVQLEDGDIKTKKGPVFHTAIIAGTMGAKKTHELIPFCHPLGLENCKININVIDQQIIINTEVTITGKTGVEMEALTAASVAALTVYDMCKALSHNMIIKEIKLIEKTGGKSDFKQ